MCGISLGQLEALGNYFPAWFHRLLARAWRNNRITLPMLRRKDARSRLAAFLLDLSERFRVRGQSRQAFNLSMSRQDIGNHPGMTIETLSRALSYCRKARLIDIDHRRATIRDFERLYTLAHSDGL